MTNKVICVEKVKEITTVARSNGDTDYGIGWNAALTMIADMANSGRLTPSPAPAASGEVVEGLRKRYEYIRQSCVDYAGLHPDDKSGCRQSVLRINFPSRRPIGLTVNLAALCDDMMLALSSPARAGVASLQGRVEALRIILGLCPESGLEDCVSWSTDITGENVASWDEEKLKKLLNIGGPIDHSPVAKIMEYAEELYWQAESRKSDLEFFPQRCRELESEVECLRAELRKRPTPTTNTREGM